MMMRAHEYIWGTVRWGHSGSSREKERVLMGEEDGSMLHIYI
jgi:hypothetical protein